MILIEKQIQRSLELVIAAFPRFSDWQYANVEDDRYSGFALWSEYVWEPDDEMPRRYYLTFDTFEKKWRGHLTIGQHTYFWSNADFGDAALLDTNACVTLEDAIKLLKEQLADLFDVFSRSAER